MDIFDVECVVAGAGVVGLACAAALARAGREVIVLEAAANIGAGISSRNSEVIHAGIYYPTGSIRHRLCVRGRRLLYPYLESRGVAHRKCGKLIVATDAAEEVKIAAIHAQALANEVEHMQMLTRAQARAIEPNLHCVSATLSPETGIVDSHGLMLALQGEFESAGGAVAFEAPIRRGALLADGRIEIETGGASPARIRCRQFVNSAGLYAQQVANAIEGFPAEHVPKLTLAKGSYFGCAATPAFSRLIYPAPVEGGLGVHLTLDLGGRMRFGPDVEWLNHNDPARVDYAVDPQRAESFYAAIRRYWPGLRDGALTPDYSGCRPKLSGPGQPAQDFRIDSSQTHGVEGLVNLFGIESPGLTSSLAIAEEVLARLEGSAPHAVEALRPAVFFDRDGTLNVDDGYTFKPEHLRWIDGAKEAIAHVNARGWLAIVVTNQSGVARGLYSEADVVAFHARMQQDLAAAGARIDAFYYAPHHAEAVTEEYRHADHPDRKPNPGMIHKALRAHPVDSLRALMIGDHPRDAEAGRAAGLASAVFPGGNLLAFLTQALAETRWGSRSGA